jgi:hypothetical protein
MPTAMEIHAREFDEPVNSEAHCCLAEYGWIGGNFVTVRYWLGRLLDHNFFRESDEAVTAAMQRYFASRGCAAGAVLVRDLQAWSAAALVLQRHAAATLPHCAQPRNPRLAAALEAVMINPEIPDAELAAFANTTEKQIARMSYVFLIRKLWRLRDRELGEQ